MIPTPARRLEEQYEIVRKLGEGSFSETFLARDRNGGDECVLKRLAVRHVRDPKVLESFEREALVLAGLNHPRIPRFRDVFTTGAGPDRSLCLVQSFVPGRSLRELLETGRRFTEREAIALAIGVCWILEYLQSFSPPIVHRDIKPGNLVLAGDDPADPWLIDFGCVLDRIAPVDEGSVTVVGTFCYMPPEQLESVARPCSDLYSLGVTLIHLLSRRDPRQIEKKALRLHFRPYVAVSGALASVLDRLVEPDWTRRYETAADLRADLERVRDGLPPMAGRRRERRVRSALAAAAIAASAVIGGLALPRIDSGPAPRPPAQTPTVATSVPAVTTEASGSATLVRGRLRYAGRPLPELKEIEPTFWFRNEETNTVQTARVVHTSSTFEVRDLPPGTYGMAVDVDANSDNALRYPGDYRTFTTISVAGPVVHVDVDLQRLLHLTSPVDNGEALARWREPCEGKDTWDSPVAIAWTSIGPGVSYDYQVQRVACPFRDMGPVKGGTTRELSVSLALGESAPGEFYLLRLTARRAGFVVGQLMTHGSAGHGWDYRFRVASGASGEPGAHSDRPAGTTRIPPG